MARVLKTIDKTFDLLRKTLEWRLRDTERVKDIIRNCSMLVHFFEITWNALHLHLIKSNYFI